jgi:hypothetical protein
MDRNDQFTIFKTVKSANIVIIQQPATYLERYPDNNKQGKAGKVKRKRQIQYVEYLDTIFVDEQKSQDQDLKISPVYLAKKGSIKVDNDNITLIKFLTLHPDNIANGGKLFKLVNVAKDEEFEIESYEKLIEAEGSILGANDNLLRVISVWFLGNSYLNERASKLKKILILKAKNDNNFVDNLNKFIDDKNNEEKLTVTIALKEDIVKLVGGKTIAWSDTGAVIFNGSQATDVIKEYAIWVQNDEEGRAHLKALMGKMKKD